MALGVSFLLFLQLPNQMCAKISIKNLSRPSSPRSELSATPVLSWTSFTTNKESVKLDRELQKCVYPTIGGGHAGRGKDFFPWEKELQKEEAYLLFFLFQIPTFFCSFTCSSDLHSKKFLPHLYSLKLLFSCFLIKVHHFIVLVFAFG